MYKVFHDWNTFNISVMLSTLKICFPYGIHDILLAILLYSVKLGLYLRNSKCIHTFFINCSRILKNISEKTLKHRCSSHTVNTYENSASFYTKGNVQFLTTSPLYLFALFQLHRKTSWIHLCHSHITSLSVSEAVIQLGNKSDFYCHYGLGKTTQKPNFHIFSGQLLTQTLIWTVRPFSWAAAVVSKNLTTFRI